MRLPPRWAVAIPADSCPRCWSANSAKYAESGDVVLRRKDAEDAALVARTVAMVDHGFHAQPLAG